MSFTLTKEDLLNAVVPPDTRVSRPPEAKLSPENVVAIFLDLRANATFAHLTSQDCIGVLVAAAVQFGVSQTVDEADYSTYEFVYKGDWYPLDPVVAAIHKLPHPTDSDMEHATVRNFGRSFAKAAFNFLKAHNGEAEYLPALAAKYPDLCKGYEYVAVDFFPQRAPWYSQSEMEALQAVRKKALEEA